MINISFNNELHPGQQEIWDYLMEGKKRVVVNTGRQTGKTTLAKRWALNRVVNDPGCEIGWICPENKHFMKVYAWFTTNLASIIKKQDSQKSVIWFQNGSVLYFYSVDNYMAIRGQTFTYRILDEYAFGRFHQEEAIQAYAPTMVAKGKQELILSTPRGKNGHYKAFQEAQESPNQAAVYMKTEDNPYVDKEFLKSERDRLPHHIYQQEYEGAFLDSGGEVFSSLDKVCVIDRYEGYNPKKLYYAGIDWGLKNDQSVLTIVDNYSNVVCIEGSYEKDYPSIINRFADIIKSYKCEKTIAETNGVGMATVDYLKRLIDVEDFTMSNSSKQDLVTLTRTKIEQGLVKLPTKELCPKLYNQLSDYEVSTTPGGLYRYGHPKGGHDDFVDSLMFAVKAAHNPFTATTSYKPRVRTNRFRMT